MTLKPGNFRAEISGSLGSEETMDLFSDTTPNFLQMVRVTRAYK